jgi:pimeloyl-ACP methyl ester carboxylesterase
MDLQKHILYIPGTSGLKDMGRVQHLSRKAEQAGFNFSFLKAWNDAVDLQSKTLQQIVENVVSAISSLPADEIHVVAKSFGAGVMLLRTWPRISKMVLWAPAVEVSNTRSFDAVKNTELKDLALTDMATDIETLSQIRIPTLVLRGTEDDVVPLSLLQSITEHLSKGQLKALPGMGHSPKTEQELDYLVENTIHFLM